MADKKKGTIEGGSASGTKAPDKGAGKKAVVPEAAGESAPQIAPSMKSTKIPKLAKKNKSRLPRREKESQAKRPLIPGRRWGGVDLLAARC
jgi:hypothetical protein